MLISSRLVLIMLFLLNLLSGVSGTDEKGPQDGTADTSICNAKAGGAEGDGAEECENSEKIRMITHEELEKHNGKVPGEKIYLSILGDVYDVTEGERYYAGESGYSVFAGRDGVVPFITGKFDEEEANKSTDVLTDAQLHSLKTSWVKFYKEAEHYPFVGKLVGRYYDAKGNPTEELKRVWTRWENYVPPPKPKRKPSKRPLPKKVPKKATVQGQPAASMK